MLQDHKRKKKQTDKNTAKRINIALQGGGTHAAFQWGILDRLLEENISIEGISATGMSAMSAAAMVCGLLKNGNEGGRQALTNFWHTLSKVLDEADLYKKWSGMVGGVKADWAPLKLYSNIISQVLSPYQTNPENKRPIIEALNNTIDFELLQKSKKIKLYINATNTQTNHLQIFTNPEISIEALLASECSPMLYQAVNCRGYYYWDGGFTGNPLLEPLIDDCEAADIFILPLNPLKRPIVPTTTYGIMDRLEEITFNSPLISSLKTIRRIINLSKSKQVQENRYTALKLHMIFNEPYLSNLDLNSKTNSDLGFITALREAGRETATEWLEENIKKIGLETTMDLKSWSGESDD
ncbi:MAG: patatin-like phospholipase family protein [Alphaproteobacteria bacterium]|nr:patatin-like phospholipase family protein [Alphaproteobacteria bacterium]